MLVTLLLRVHVAAGTVALLSLWIPLVTKKGGRVHRRAGWVFVVAIAVLAATALAVCAIRVLDPSSDRGPGAIFLAFLALLASSSAFYGVRILRQKGRTGPHGGLVDLGVTSLFAACSAALLVYGVSRGSVLSICFAVLGLLLSARQLRTLLRPPPFRQFWWTNHMFGMGTASIATVTAFLVVNFGGHMVVWLLPPLAGGAGISVWIRRYERRLREPS